MGIQKPYLDSFTAKELMAFIDCYVENHVLPQKVFDLPPALVVALGHFVIDFNRHHASVDFDGDLHPVFLLFRFGFCEI